MKLYDLSVPIHEGMALWPSDPPLSMKLAKSMARGDRSNVTRLEFGAHTGTHMDAPFHFVANGAGIDQIPLETVIGPCRVFDLTSIPGHIDRAVVESCDLRGVTRALFKTRNSEGWARAEHAFDKEFRAIVLDGAQLLVEHGVKLVGVDYLSVEPYGSKEHPVHLAFLPANVIIIEGLNLSAVPAGDYELIALPMKLKGCDGAPARVVLRQA
jgi:arylformamidase